MPIYRDGDFYIDNSNQDFYLRENGVWVRKGNIRDEGANGLVSVDPIFKQGFDLNVVVQRIRYLGDASFAIGLDQTTVVDRLRAIAVQLGIGFSQSMTPVQRTRFLAVAHQLGIDQATALSVIPVLESLAAAPSLGFGLSITSLDRIRLLTANPALGLSIAVALTHTLPVVPSTTTYDSGSGNYTVPAYNTLTIETWGAGGSGAGRTSTTGLLAGNPGGATTAGSQRSGGGGGGPQYTNTSPGGGGGSASGGNTNNTPGNAGGGDHSGYGAACPNGGGQVNCNVNSVTQSPGAAPGGGGPGNITSIQVPMAGAGSGGYTRSIFTYGVTAGYPAIGSTMAWSVGVGGAPTGITAPGGSGANGRVRFTVA